MYYKNVVDDPDSINEYQMTSENKINSWFYRWNLSILWNNGLTIFPKVNLTRNIGIQNGAHTGGATAAHLLMDKEMQFPLVHPKIMASRNFLSKPVNPFETKVEQIEHEKNAERISKEYNYKFIKLLHLAQYHAVLMLYDEVLKCEDTFLGFRRNVLTSYHLQFLYYTSFAYFNIGDFEHCAALLRILITFLPPPYSSQHFVVINLLINSLIRQEEWDEAKKIIDEIDEENLSENEKNEIENLKQIINEHL